MLFLIYINDLCDVSRVFGFYFFLPMIQTYSFDSHNNVDFLETTLNEELLKLTDWCQAGKLSVNYSKSNKFMAVFKPRQRKSKILILN